MTVPSFTRHTYTFYSGSFECHTVRFFEAYAKTRCLDLLFCEEDPLEVFVSQLFFLFCFVLSLALAPWGRLAAVAIWKLLQPSFNNPCVCLKKVWWDRDSFHQKQKLSAKSASLADTYNQSINPDFFQFTSHQIWHTGPDWRNISQTWGMILLAL